LSLASLASFALSWARAGFEGKASRRKQPAVRVSKERRISKTVSFKVA
jgi:hypothetical protein